MLKKIASTVVLSSVVFLGGCAMQPTHATVYSNATSPYMVTSAEAGSKVGESGTCKNLLGIIATGDCSIATAAKNGGIKTVSTVDWKGTNVLGLWSTGKTVVTGK